MRRAHDDVEMQAPEIKQEPQEVLAENRMAGEAVEAPSMDVIADVEMGAAADAPLKSAPVNKSKKEVKQEAPQAASSSDIKLQKKKDAEQL